MIEEEFLGTLLYKPELLNETTIPSDYLLDQDIKFAYELLKKQYTEHNLIDIVGLINDYTHLFKSKEQQQRIVNRLTEIQINVMPDKDLDYIEHLLLRQYKDFRIDGLSKEYASKSISQEDFFKELHKIDELSLGEEKDTLTSEQIKDLVMADNKRLNFRFNTLSTVAKIEEHDLVVVAARPATGKTSFVLNLLESLSHDYKCILFNMEMTDKQVYTRLTSIISKIPMENLTKPVSTYQEQVRDETFKDISKRKIKVYSTGQTIQNIKRVIARETKDEHTIVFIDYVGLIGTSEKYKSLYEKVTAIVKELRTISLNYNCTIFLVAQMNRESEKTKDTPKQSDLKESGELEQSASCVLMLHNPNGESQEDVVPIKVFIAKNRNGKRGIITYDYAKNTQRFEEQRRY